MQTENRLFDDLARVASGAINTLGGLREEIELRVKERLERFAGEMDLVSREEFDAVKAMATKARTEQAALEKRVAELEAALAGTPDRPTDAAASSKKSSTAKSGRGASSSGRKKSTAAPTGGGNETPAAPNSTSGEPSDS